PVDLHRDAFRPHLTSLLTTDGCMPGASGGRQDESGRTRPTEMPLGGSASPVRPLGRRAAASAKHERNTGSGPGERARSVQRVWNRPETASRDLGFWGWRRSPSMAAAVAGTT